MKKLIISLILLLTCVQINSYYKLSSSKEVEVKIQSLFKNVDYSDYFDRLLLNKLAYKESRGNSRIVNSIGCMGKYQFKESTARYLGFDISLSKFRTDPEHFNEKEQDRACLKLLKIHRQLLSNVIKQYNNKTINDVFITETGILAAAHLAGPEGVKAYFNDKQNKKDKFGTSVETYLKEFSTFI